VIRRVVLFLDYQNVYKGARETLHQHWEPSQCGQIDPMKLGQLLVERSPGRDGRMLAGVRVYRGQPDSSKEPRAYGANLRQCSAWERAGATVITRTLRYPIAWPAEKPEEKGIDVALAMDFHAMAVRGDYDVGILMSTDTDLKPALEVEATSQGETIEQALANLREVVEVYLEEEPAPTMFQTPLVTSFDVRIPA
jgi:hypothetical protein